MKKTIIAIVVLAVVILGIVLLSSPNSKVSGEHDAFAQCITEAGLKMYGTDWCPHCKDQKKMFGKSFDHVEYINCDKERETCLLEGVQGYPTWKFEGQSYPGTQQLETLSQLTGCEL